MFAVAYGLCTVAFVPRPLLNLAAGALFGSQLGLGTALAGTVLGAGVAFGLGRILGQGTVLRPLLRARWLKAADGVACQPARLPHDDAGPALPRLPFWAANYCAAVSRMGWLPFLLATALGSIPNTAAYAVAGARASAPTSPAFLIADGLHRAAGPGRRGGGLAQAPPPARRLSDLQHDRPPARSISGTHQSPARRLSRRRTARAVRVYTASMTIASASPPASHIVCRP